MVPHHSLSAVSATERRLGSRTTTTKPSENMWTHRALAAVGGAATEEPLGDGRHAAIQPAIGDGRA